MEYRGGVTALPISVALAVNGSGCFSGAHEDLYFCWASVGREKRMDEGSRAAGGEIEMACSDDVGDLTDPADTPDVAEGIDCVDGAELAGEAVVDGVSPEYVSPGDVSPGDSVNRSDAKTVCCCFELSPCIVLVMFEAPSAVAVADIPELFSSLGSLNFALPTNVL